MVTVFQFLYMPLATVSMQLMRSNKLHCKYTYQKDQGNAVSCLFHNKRCILDGVI